MIAITPDPNAVQVGPLSVPWYGLGYAAAIAVGVWLGGREAERRGIERRHIGEGLLLVVILGIIGARLYHVIDQWSLYVGDPLRIVLPPYSGLGLYGGIAGGLLGVLIYARRNGLSFLRLADALVPSVFIGQAIARWGNFFNQELYGPPTEMPWGIAIECANRIPEYSCDRLPFATTAFHPLFFYESTLNLAGGLLALWLGRRFGERLRDGDLVAFWFIWYGATRALLEPLRAEYNWTFFGVPVATLIALTAIAAGLVFLAWRQGRTAEPPDDELEEFDDSWDEDGEEDAAPDAPTAARPVDAR